MLRDDASPEERDRWFRRTPEEIEAEKAARWNADWNALRLPEHLAREPDTMAGGGGSDLLAGGPGQDRVTKRPSHIAPKVEALDAYQRALLDTIAGHESPGYDVLYSPTSTLRRIARGTDGQPDYRQHPNSPALISNGPNKGRSSSAAGRYQILNSVWTPLSKSHGDLTDFSPANQDKAAWYLGWERYSRETGGRDLAADLRDPKFYPQITRILRKEWTSLPGGIEQGQGQSEFDRRMAEGVRRYQPAPSR